MTRKELIQKLVDLDIVFHSSLEELEVLRADRVALIEANKKIIETAEATSATDVDVPVELQIQMQANIEKYKKLSLQTSTLRSDINSLKAQFDLEIANTKGKGE